MKYSLNNCHALYFPNLKENRNTYIFETHPDEVISHSELMIDTVQLDVLFTLTCKRYATDGR